MKRVAGVLCAAIGAVLMVTLCACGGPARPRAAAATPAGPWHYVVLGDSETFGFGRFVAAGIEAELGVQVVVWQESVNGLSSGSLLSYLRRNESLREEIRQAEIVSFNANPTDYAGWGACVLAGDTPEVLTSDARAHYRADLDSVLSEIFALRRGLPTMIRAMDFYVPVYSEWRKQGIVEPCRAFFDTINEVIHEAAEAHGVPVVEVCTAINGVTHEEDPRDKGLIDKDGEHTNSAGQQVIADAFLKVGFEFLVP